MAHGVTTTAVPATPRKGRRPGTVSSWPLAGPAGAALCRRSVFVGVAVPVRAHCPHCIAPCLVSEQHLGSPVRCHKCRQTFTVQPTALTSKPPTTEPIPQTAGALRLDIAGVTSIGRQRSRNEASFLVQRLTWSDRNQNHQLGLVIVADGMGGHAGGDQAARLILLTIGLMLTPLLTAALNTQQREVSRVGLTAS